MITYLEAWIRCRFRVTRSLAEQLPQQLAIFDLACRNLLKYGRLEGLKRGTFVDFLTFLITGDF